VQRIDAVLDQPLAHLDRFREGVSGRPAAERRQRIIELLRADLHLQVEVAADAGADRAHDLAHEPGALLERAAVLVLPVVDGGAEELRNQVAVGAVQLDAVEPRLAGAPRPFGELGHRLVDLRDRHPLALEAVQRIAPVGGRDPLRVLDAVDIALPAAVAQLQDELAVVAMHRFADRPPERDAAVVVDHRVVRHDTAAQVHRHERGDDGADAALGELRLPVDARLVAGAVVVVEAARHVGAEDAVLDRQIPEVERFENRRICHIPTCPSASTAGTRCRSPA
jgi:hypothetical protein